MTTRQMQPAVGSQNRMSRTVSETPKEVWRIGLRGNWRKIKKSPKRSLSRNSSHKTRKTSQKPPQKNNTTTTRRYIACICNTVHAAEGKPPVLITASAERHRCSGRYHQKTTVIIKTHCKTQGKRSCVRTANEEGRESNKIAKARAKTSDDRYTRSG